MYPQRLSEGQDSQHLEVELKKNLKRETEKIRGLKKKIKNGERGLKCFLLHATERLSKEDISENILS